eukprot:TRINITY_DN3386_c1_g1_i1.p1 TRINITY_DN3386_c1_g1~~TRINITY_DN3386_c1_g1_i1.p1  ORF type:complete len:167 (-),score=29.87 TRINITY_DN3386_c1_g1_i1:23-523(-)
MYFVVRQWPIIPIHLEFYLFVHKRKLITIAQYHENCLFPELLQNRFDILVKLNTLSSKILGKIPDESCLLHVGLVPSIDEARIIEYIPLTLGCIFLSNAPTLFGKKMADHLTAPLINDKVNTIFREEPVLPGVGIPKSWQDWFKTTEGRLKEQAAKQAGNENCSIQ